MKKLREAKSSTTSEAPPDCDEFIRRGMFICGSPETVREDDRASPEGHRLQRAGGDDADRQHAGGADPQKSMRLFAEKVMPPLRDPAGAPKLAFATAK